MSKNIAKKTEKPSSDKPNMDRSRNSYPPEQTDTDEPQGRSKQSAAGMAEALKPPERTVRVEFSSTPSKVAANPPPRPNSVPSATATNPPPAAAPQKSPNIVPTPKPSAVVTTPPAKTIQSAPQAKTVQAAPPGKTVQSVPPTRTEKPEILVQAQKPTAPTSTNVKFVLHRPEAKQVWLCGDFNRWSRSNTPMKRRNDGQWETTVALAPGRYQYKFLVDSQWITDPAARQNVANPFGSLNSVLEVQG